MYTFKINDFGSTTVSTLTELLKAELDESVNSADTLTISIAYNNALFDSFNQLRTIICVYDEYDLLQFKGRLIDSTVNFDGSKELRFEGELAYLNDVQYPPYEFQGSITELLESVLNHYNSKCTEGKEINLGNVTVTDNNDYIARSNEDYSSCWEVLSDKLVEEIGGYLVLRYVDNTRYLDYLVTPGKHSTQTIEFGKNLLDLTDYIDSTSVATVLIPLGAKDDDTKQRLTIESVNEGLNYLESSLIDTYGRIEQVQTWDDVTLAENLLTKAQNYLSTMILQDVTIDVSAIDLGFTSEDIERFKVGDTIDCVSTPHNITVTMMLTTRNRDLLDPTNDKLSIGTEEKIITSSIISNQKKNDDTESKLTGNYLQDVITKATDLITGGLGGYIKWLYNSNGYPSALIAMDTDNIATAQDVLMIDKNGIGFSQNGVNGPFTNAWTIDGVFNTKYINSGVISGECIEIDLDTGKCVWGKRNESGEFSANTSIVFNLDDLTINTPNGIVVNNLDTLFKTNINDNYFEITYDGETRLYIDSTQVLAHNLTAQNYLQVENVYRVQSITLNGEQFVGHYSMFGGED